MIEQRHRIADRTFALAPALLLVTMLACQGDTLQAPEDFARLGLRVQVAPPQVALLPGESFQFVATVLDDTGRTLEAPVRWSASGGQIDGNGLFVAGSRTGSYAITAESSLQGSGSAMSAAVRILSPTEGSPPDTSGSAPDGGDPSSGGTGSKPEKWSVVIVPVAVDLEVGESLQFRATVFNPAGQAVTETVTWSAVGGTIDATGLYAAGAQSGTFRVTATSSRAAGQAIVRITDPASAPPTPSDPGDPAPPSDPTPPPPPPPSDPGDPTPASISISPGSAQTNPGGVVQFSATVRDGAGNPVPATVGWEATGGSVSSGGRYTAGSSSGSFHVTARSSGLSATANVSIVDSSPPPSNPSGIEVRPGQSIQAAVDAHPAGTTFVIKSGTHRRQRVTPKDGNIFVGEGGAVLDGENATQHAFHGKADNVTIRNLEITRYSTPTQAGTINAVWNEASGWTIEDCEIHRNGGAGIYVGHRMTVRRSFIHHNGQLGLLGWGNDARFENNEIANNNTAGHDPFWAAGGTKFILSTGIVFKGNYVHHNNGPGIWFDGDNNRSTIEGNRVEDNVTAGIFYEVSYNGTIRNNTVRRNGSGRHDSFHRSGILISESPGVEVYGNTLQDNANGIVGLQNSRGSGPLGSYVVKDLWVHDNTVTMSNGKSGLRDVTGDGQVFGRNNRFDRNTYHVAGNGRPFAGPKIGETIAEWKALGQDTGSTFHQ